MLARESVKPIQFYPQPVGFRVKLSDHEIHWLVRQRCDSPADHAQGCDGDGNGEDCGCMDDTIAFVPSAISAERICIALNGRSTNG